MSGAQDAQQMRDALLLYERGNLRGRPAYVAVEDNGAFLGLIFVQWRTCGKVFNVADQQDCVHEEPSLEAAVACFDDGNTRVRFYSLHETELTAESAA